MIKKLNILLGPKLKLVAGTRLTSFLFIGLSVLIAAGVLFAANMYYNIDTGEVVVEEIKRITSVLRATGGAIVGGSSSQNPTSGYIFEVVGKARLATTTVANGQLEFSGSDTYAGFKAPSSYGTTTSAIYVFPQHGTSPPSTDYVLTWQSGNQLQWKEITGVGGAGDITAVGNVSAGAAFTGNDAGGSPGNTLWFEGATANDFEIALTAADPTADYTITLPAATGYVALGTGTANYVAYWTGTNTLAGEAQLSVSRGGTGRSSWTPGGVLYASASATLTNTAAGSNYQILTSQGTTDPLWRNISDLITVTNGLTGSGTTQLTLKLGGTLTENTTVSLAGYNMIFNMTGTGDFKVQDAGTDILVVSDDGKIYYKTYPLAESGKQVLREMIPIFGFDLPSQTATTSYVQISRTIQDYPFAVAETGTTRVHKFVIRIGAANSSATTTWRVWNETVGSQVATFDLALDQSTSLEKGEVYISSNVSIPTNTDDWRLEMKTNGNNVRVYQIFLASYDQLQ